jgi:hypothetical protein
MPDLLVPGFLADGVQTIRHAIAGCLACLAAFAPCFLAGAVNETIRSRFWVRVTVRRSRLRWHKPRVSALERLFV